MKQLITIVLLGFLALVAGCGTAPMAFGAEVQHVLAPTGKLRVGLTLGTPGSMLRVAASDEKRNRNDAL